MKLLKRILGTVKELGGWRTYCLAIWLGVTWRIISSNEPAVFLGGLGILSIFVVLDVTDP